MTVLFITRKYPPQVGGMENYSYGLISHLAIRTRLIALKHSQIHLIWFLPYAFIAGLFLSWRVEVIYLCDGLLSPLGYLLKLLTRKPVCVTVHGLDVTYQNRLYQKVNVGCLRKLDRVFCVSRSTIEECVKRGIDREKCVYIPNGVQIPSIPEAYTREQLEKLVRRPLAGKKIILSIGRLVARKGTAWFIREVLPLLPDDMIYLVAGDGPERQRVEAAVSEKNLSTRVFLLGQVSESERELLFRTADVFVMPNQRVPGDMEGFGIVAIEAAGRGLPVVVARLEGLADAISDGENGYLVDSENAGAFARKIRELLSDPGLAGLSERFAAYTKKYYNWKYISHLYLEELKKHFSNATD
ncbi:MAG: glycosyltransferase family 4 protein [Patescibacteria group bacterium]